MLRHGVLVTAVVCGLSAMLFASPALVAAIFYFVPHLLPFFAPGKRPVAGKAGFSGQVFFFNGFHLASCLAGVKIVLRWLNALVVWR